jgi:RHS repeat-associated protein
VLQARYSHGEEIDQPLAMARGGASYFYGVDHLGSVRLVTDAAGSVANRYDYDAFGNWEDTSYETVANPFGFTARERDAESGLMFYRARYYDPKIGRFISQDPIGFEAGDLNLYRYVNNMPTIFADPTGEIVMGGFAAVGVMRGIEYARALVTATLNNAWGATVAYSLVAAPTGYFMGFDFCAAVAGGTAAGMAAGSIVGNQLSGLSALGATVQAGLWGVALYGICGLQTSLAEPIVDKLFELIS